MTHTQTFDDCATALEQLCRLLFPHLLTRPMSTMHRAALRDYASKLATHGYGVCNVEAAIDGTVLRHAVRRPMSQRTGELRAVVAPRGAAKSTFYSLVLPLLDALFGVEHFVVIFSATQRQAQTRVAALAREVRRNVLLRSRLGLPPRPGADESSSVDALQIPGFRVESYGARCEIRGISFEGRRPSLVVLDDCDTDDAGYSPDLSERVITWFNREVRPMGDTFTNIIAVGTLVHNRSLLAHLCERRNGFNAQRFQAVVQWSTRPDLWLEWEELLGARSSQEAAAFLDANQDEMLRDTQVLWPEHEPYETLMTMRAQMGHRNFAAEKMNEPRTANAAEPVMAVERWGRFRLSIDGAYVMELGPDSPRKVALNEMTIVTYIDPAGGRNATCGDNAAIVTIGELPPHATGANMRRVYILDAKLLRAGVAKQARLAVESAMQFNAQILMHEESGAFSMTEFLTQARKEITGNEPATAPRLHAVTHTASKVRRAGHYETLLTSSGVCANVDLPPAFLEECAGFAMGLRIGDDAPDALIGALEALSLLQTRTPQKPRRLGYKIDMIDRNAVRY